MTRKFLEDLGVEKEAVEKILNENKGDIAQVQSDLSAAREQLAQREKDMENLKAAAGDAEKFKSQLDELQKKYDSETEAYQKQLAERDYMDAIRRTIAEKGIKFSSKSAEKAYIADLKEKGLTLKDGVLTGFDEYHKAQVEADPNAFQPDKPVPAFVKPVGPGGPPPEKPTRAAQLAAQHYQNLYGTQNNKE